jgi:polyferredoxin
LSPCFSPRAVRRLFQSATLAAAAVTGYRAAMGWTLSSVETYCPFGGLETAYAFFTRQRFTCAAGELNLTLFLALLGLTFMARKSFCSWVCPFGTVSEWLAVPGRKIFRKPRRDPEGRPLQLLEPSRRWDAALRWLRLPVLCATLFFTFKTGELIFRGYDPYYILFSFHGHDVRWWSYIILGTLLAAALLVPMAWCRYLCPLGVALWPLSALGRIRLRRDRYTCTSCGACDRACPHSIDVSRVEQVRSGECTLCLECSCACPVPGTLVLHLEGLKP